MTTTDEAQAGCKAYFHLQLYPTIAIQGIPLGLFFDYVLLLNSLGNANGNMLICVFCK